MLTMQQQEELVQQGFAKKKFNPELNINTYKYAKKVMYEYLWKKYPDLLECRGHGYDATTGSPVVFAPKKAFNYLEDGHWADVPLDNKVQVFKKWNGFMSTVSVHYGKVIVSTTGTTDSKYVEMAKEMIFKTWPEHGIRNWCKDTEASKGSWLFEIIHVNDPHIVDEGQPRAVYLGYQDSTGFTPVYTTTEWEETREITLGQALENVKDFKGEGFMLYDKQGNVCKLKSPYYIGKKKLMRMTDSRIDQMFANPDKYFKENMPGSWMWFTDTINDYLTESTWKSMGEQERREFIEDFED